jgi:hypothetical protein
VHLRRLPRYAVSPTALLDLSGVSDRLERSAPERWRAAASAVAQRLWLTTSMLCPSGSRTNAP